MTNSSFLRFKTMTSVVALFISGVISHPSMAACISAPMSSVICSGKTTGGYTDAANNLNLYVNDGASVNNAGNAIDLSGTGVTVRLYKGSEVNSDTTGIMLQKGGTITNDGVINKTSGTQGIEAHSGKVTINNDTGLIKGINNGLHIHLTNEDVVINNGLTTGSVDAVIMGDNKAAIYLNNLNNVFVTNNLKGKILGTNNDGVVLDTKGNLTLNNEGLIEVTAGKFAIRTTTGNDLVRNEGTIKGDINLDTGNNTVGNRGTIEGSVKTAGGIDILANDGRMQGNVDLGNGNNTIENGGLNQNAFITGSITTGKDSDLFKNWGKIDATIGGINLGAGGNGIANFGTIEGSITTLEGDDTLTNNGKITGGINLGDGVNKITNSNTGSITGNIATGMNNDTLENQGTITGDIGLGDGTNKITNSNTGSITGNIATGMNNDTMDNSGTVGGDVNLGEGANTLTNNASGGIGGNVTGGTGVDTVTNRGNITGNISLGAGNDVMTWHIDGTVGGTIDGGAMGDDTLNLTGSGSTTRVISNAITNFENLKVDAGISDVWVLDNNYSFSTKTDIVDGQLRIAAGRTLTTPNVTLNGVVAGRARLSGEGAITGNLVVTKGIVIAGNEATGTGTLTVSGNYSNSADSILDISVGPGAQQTKLAVGGNITLDGTLRLSSQLGLVKGNVAYDIITYGGMRTGQFATTNLPAGNRFTQYQVDYTSKANAVQVIVNKTNYSIVGMTYNQREAGDGLYRGMVGSVAGSDMEAVAGAFEGLPNDEAMQRALDSLSGVEWASMGEVRGGVSRSFRGVGMERVGMMSEGMGVWGQLLQGRNDVEGDGNGAGIKGKVQGLVGGMEYGFGEGKVGVMVGYGDGQMKLSGMGEGKVEMVMGGVYGGWSFGGIEVEGGLSYGEGKQRVERQIGVGGVQRRVEGGEKVREFGGNVGVGYGIKLGMIEITPSVGFEVVRYEEKGFKENGGGDVGLVGGKERGWRGHGEVGLKVGGVFQAGAVTFSPYVHGGYERVVMGKGYMERDVAFAGNENGTGFNVRGTDGGKDQFKAGAGINVGFGPVVLELGYEQSVGGKRDNQMFQGGLSIRW